ncbi:TadE/TadG family type IV pilus assembly protein [Microbacterium sp. ProA8]|uniref:TadE/TadG family type IV pilus assembly protein n=1 Tax=Microbacterium chionoecetis TaxID=3153754 RepID=UPI003265FB0E
MRVAASRMSGLRAWIAAEHRDDTGASPVEFVLVGTLLTVLTLGVLQFGLAVYVRNVVHDAAVEGAYHAALADTTLADGAQRTRDILSRTIGREYATDVSVREGSSLGQQTTEIQVAATLPLVGLLGAPRSLEVTAHAPVESFD